MFLIDGNNLNVQNSIKIIIENLKIGISGKVALRIRKSRALVEKWTDEGEIVYGINTGFGEFKDIIISKEKIEKLQENLILSHSAGVGDYIPDEIARLILLFRINSLIKGYSGVRLELIDFLIKYFNAGLVPQIPEKGSVGCSGDLAPLAHMAQTFLGYGYMKYKGKVYKSKTALAKAGLKPVILSSKEGLALINGTQMMSAYLCKSISETIVICKIADIAGAMTVEATKSTSKAYDARIQKIRPHKGQSDSAYNLRCLLKGSEILKSHEDCGKVQDAYSIRCIPQVHGVAKDALNYCIKVLNTEINSVTDNPLIFPEDSEHLEGGNFHGEPLAVASDFLKIAVCELGSISERRINRLLDGSLSGLPRFLAKEGGINSGFMIAQYTAAAIASENKVLAHPASVDSIPTSANQEDHNSMGSIAARKLYEVTWNVKTIIAIELLCGAQALDFLRPLKAGPGVEKARELIRKEIKFSEKDEILSDMILKAKNAVFGLQFISKVEKITGGLKI